MADCGFHDDPVNGVAGSKLLIAFGPTLQVDIGFDAKYDPTKPQAPTPGIKGVHALVDTGATECCIDSMLAIQLNLPLVDKSPVSGVHGKAEVNVYMAQIHVPALSRTIYGRFNAVHLKAGGQLHSALIGRTFLQYFVLSYDGRTGQVTIVEPPPRPQPAPQGPGPS